MANSPLANAQSDVLLSGIAQGATTATLTGGNFGTPSGQIYLTFDYDVAAKYEVKKATVAGASVTSMTHISGANVAHDAGCKVGRMLNAEVIKDITDITDDHETRIATAEGDITVLESGWTASPALTFAAADGPTQTSTATGDYTTKLYPGVRLKYDQNQAIQNYWSFDTNSADSKGSATMADIGTPTYTAGKFGNALTLNGSDQALSITDAAAFKPTDNFTIGCWFKTANTGALKMLFQSYSDNTNSNGIQMFVSAANILYARVGANAADPTSLFVGTTTVTDGNWHYAVWSVRNNFSQVYLDGKLETSGYCVAPTYAATNYVRIGCSNVAGSNAEWFNGQIDDLFIAAYALDEQTIAAKYAAATAQGTGDLTLTKYALVTASSYSAPNTTVTIYSGTDHTMMNSTISNAYYSTQKAPYGFPLGREKWSVTYVNSTTTYINPAATTYYNFGSASYPIGRWRLTGQFVLHSFKGSTGFGPAKGGIGTSNASFITELTATHRHDSNVSAIYQDVPCFVEKDINLYAKTTLYLNAWTAGDDGELGFNGAYSPSIIKATSTLL